MAIDDTRGVLVPRSLVGGEVRLSRHEPAPELAFFVELYWIVEWDLRGRPPRVQETLSYPSVHLVVEAGRSGIFGVVTGRFTRRLEEAGQVFGIKLRPGAFYPFVQSPVSRFTDRVADLAEAFGSAGAVLERAILAGPDAAARIAFAEEFLRARLPAQDENVALVNRVLDRVLSERDITRVDDLASRAGMSERALQRLFSRYIGVSPKWAIRRYRLQEAAERLADGVMPDWVRLALELGYFDQAHFIKDFKSIIGKSPAEYARACAASKTRHP